MADVIEAIAGILRADSILMGLLNKSSPLGYMTVPQGTPVPYIILKDAANRIEDNFGGTQQDYRYIDIEVVAALESPAGSGYAVGKRILSRLKAVLDNNESALTSEDGTTICLRRMSMMPARLDTISGDDQYLRRGHEWEVVLSQ